MKPEEINRPFTMREYCAEKCDECKLDGVIEECFYYHCRWYIGRYE